MRRVLVAGKIHPIGLDLLRASPGVEIDYVEEVSLASYRPYLAEADALLIRTQPLTAEAIAEAPRLRIVSRHGVGYDSVDVAALDRRGIPLAVVGDVNSRTVAEHTMMMLLAAAKRLLAYDASVRSGDWDYRNSLEATELDGKVLLVVGFGRIGRHVTRMAHAFGLTVLASDPHVSHEAMREAGAEPVSLMDGLARADFASLHAPRDGPGAMIGDTEMAGMKDGVVIVNAARGGIVDEAALARALDSGKVSGAGLDVFGDEPPAPDNPLLADRRVVLTPHSAGLTLECAARMSRAAAQNVLDCFAGRLDPALIVNRERLPEFAA
jgi:D-3-phosphoglycerate dehydrogenase / 2-oxoglutarate reductase